MFKNYFEKFKKPLYKFLIVVYNNQVLGNLTQTMLYARMAESADALV